MAARGVTQRRAGGGGGGGGSDVDETHGWRFYLDGLSKTLWNTSQASSRATAAMPRPRTAMPHC